MSGSSLGSMIDLITLKAMLSGKIPRKLKSSGAMSSNREGSRLETSDMPAATSSSPSRSALSESSVISISTVSLAKTRVPLSLVTCTSNLTEASTALISVSRSSRVVLSEVWSAGMVTEATKVPSSKVITRVTSPPKTKSSGASVAVYAS